MVVEIEDEHSGESWQAPRGGVKIVAFPLEDTKRIRRITAQMRAGDEAAFAEFYECYCDRLYRCLILLTRGDEVFARDLLQTTMTKAMRAIREFATEHQLWNWLACIARNSFIDGLRRAKANPQLVPLRSEDGLEATTIPSADDETSLFDALERCLDVMEPQQRALVEAFYFKEGTYESIAQEQNTTPKAVESKLARARQKLRAALLQQLRYEKE
jgi:RNA polymerase sigma-70 factor (ECF subfamily)